MTLWEKYLDKAGRHTGIRGKIGLITELYNQGVPPEEWGDIIKSQGFALRDIPLGKGFDLDIQQGGYMPQSSYQQFEGQTTLPDLPVDYGINLKKKF